MIKILLVDDHELVRSGLKSILETNPNYVVVAELDSGESAVEFVQSQPETADLVLMDINMPGIGGIEATRRILQSQPSMRIVAVTALKDDPFPGQLLKAGAAGFITKGCDASEMFSAIETVMNGSQYLANRISESISLKKINGSNSDSPFAELSDREMQVMLMVTQGRSNQDISDTLFLSPKTISTYRHRLFEKLNVKNDVELTHMAIRHGVVTT
mgnify:CR=1 FL=1